MNIDTPLTKQAYELCLAIEALPASEEATALSILASELGNKLSEYEHKSKVAAASKLKVDDKVMVRHNPGCTWYAWARRHFAKYEDGKFYCFEDGKTSFTQEDIVEWLEWRLPTEEELKQ